jgi:tRNA-splicing ligase RtcB
MHLTTFGPVEAPVLKQLETCAEQAKFAVLCADNHLGYSQPIGAALAYEHFISPSGVGYDIGCGNKAARTNLQAADLNIAEAMNLIWHQISFGMGRSNQESLNDPVLAEIETAPFHGQRALLGLAEKQLGTVGSGNHYVDLFEDEDGWLWIGVHFGSRGFGHKTASGFLALAQGLGFEEHAKEGEMDSPPVLLDVRTTLGQDYIAAMQTAGRYAYAGRDWVVGKVAQLLGVEILEEIHNHHNFAWSEEHFGTHVWVVRKGCTPAWPGQEGFVGGSMGENSVILTGEESKKSAEALYSTVHGAGRVMSRTQAAGKVKYVRDEGTGKKRPVPVSAGLVDWETTRTKLWEERHIHIRGGGADEAPQVYKRLDEVLAFHVGTIRIKHRLRPVGVAMARSGEFDPYKD